MNTDFTATSNWQEFLKWVSERNVHISVPDLEFMLGIRPTKTEKENVQDKFYWSCSS